MNPLPSLISKALSRKGQFCGFLWARPAKVLKAYRGVELLKEVRTVARVGISYDNREAVKEARADGTLPAENAGLPWGQWVLYPYLITHNGSLFLRLYPVPNHVPKVRFLLNGQQVSKESVSHMLQASEFNEVREDIGCMTLNANNLRVVR